MKIIFTIDAKLDLDELRSYTQHLSQSGMANITSALEGCIHDLRDNPRLGRRTPRNDVREIIEPKYGFVIPYFMKGESLFVLRVYRSKRKPLDYRKFILP